MDVITWKDVLDSTKSSYCNNYSHPNVIRLFVGEVLIGSGYKYFTWDGKVYKYDINSDVLSATNWKVEDIK